MTDEELNELARGWVAYWHDSKNEDLWEAWNRSNDYMNEAVGSNPIDAWKMVLVVYALDRSKKIQANLAAGPIEDLLSDHGPLMIEIVEEKARADPSFAKLLAGVWKLDSMTDEVWTRLLAVRDYPGWQAIPED